MSLTACGGDSSADLGSTGRGGSAGNDGSAGSGGVITSDAGADPSAESDGGAEFPDGDGAPGGNGGTGGAVGGSGGIGGTVGGGGDAQSGSGSGTGGAIGGSGSGAGGSGGVGGGAAGSGGTPGGCIDVCGLYGAACCVSSVACIEVGHSCVADVLSASVSTTYEYAELEDKISSLPQDVLVSFTDADITWAAAESSPASRIEMHMTPEASSEYGTALEGAELHPFRFSCDGQELFVGVVYEMIGAAAIETPVLHVARDAEDSVVLSLGAVQGAWLIGSLATPEARERIDRPELRAVFCQRGALQELDAASD